MSLEAFVGKACHLFLEEKLHLLAKRKSCEEFLLLLSREGPDVDENDKIRNFRKVKVNYPGLLALSLR